MFMAMLYVLWVSVSGRWLAFLTSSYSKSFYFFIPFSRFDDHLLLCPFSLPISFHYLQQFIISLPPFFQSYQPSFSSFFPTILPSFQPSFLFTFPPFHLLPSTPIFSLSLLTLLPSHPLTSSPSPPIQDDTFDAPSSSFFSSMGPPIGTPAFFSASSLTKFERKKKANGKYFIFTPTRTRIYTLTKHLPSFLFSLSSIVVIIIVIMMIITTSTIVTFVRITTF